MVASGSLLYYFTILTRVFYCYYYCSSSYDYHYSYYYYYISIRLSLLMRSNLRPAQ